jgi:hypothetical protein
MLHSEKQYPNGLHSFDRPEVQLQPPNLPERVEDSPTLVQLLEVEYLEFALGITKIDRIDSQELTQPECEAYTNAVEAFSEHG